MREWAQKEGLEQTSPLTNIEAGDTVEWKVGDCLHERAEVLGFENDLIHLMGDVYKFKTPINSIQSLKKVG